MTQASGMAMVSFIDVYAVKETNLDGFPGAVIGYFRIHADAFEYAKGKGGWGGEGIVDKVSAVSIGGHVYILATPQPVDLDLVKKKRDEELRKRTLAELSADQIRVLGIKV